MLFFDEVMVPLEYDSAILNEHEISETFPDKRGIQWGEICPYPRSFSYDEQCRKLRTDASRAAGTGKLRFISLRASSSSEATNNWVAAIAALKNPALVRAAITDRQTDTPPITLRNDSWFNAYVPTYKGFESSYHWMLELDSTPAIPIDELWRRVALGRLGRAMKVIRRASVECAIPLAIDPINSDILWALGAAAYRDAPTSQDLSCAAIALDSVDPHQLNQALELMPWTEVLRLRREILPAVARLRKLLISSVRVAHEPQNAELAPYLAALQKIKEDYRQAQDEVASAWRKIGFRTIELASAAAATGLSSLAPNPDWVKTISAAAVIVVTKVLGASAPDLRAILRSGKARKACPLFAFDQIVARSKSASYDLENP